jgi:hypothetical protein
MKKFLPLIFLFVCQAASAGWDGVDESTNVAISMSTSRPEKFKRGETVEVFDYADRNYHEVEIEHIRSHGENVKYEVYDKDMFMQRVFIMSGKSWRH